MGLFGSTLRAVTQMVFPKFPQRLYPMGGRLNDERDYRWSIGDGSSTGLAQALMSFIINGFTQTMPAVAISSTDRIDPDQIRPDHAAAMLFRRPTYDIDLGHSWYSWQVMIGGVIVSYCADGNGYILKVRSEAGRVVQLWYVPHFMMEPRWDMSDSRVYVSSYDYAPHGVRLTEGPQALGTPNGPIYSIRPQDVIHLRDGLDPQNPRKGLSKLKVLLRELYTDEEAARWTASLLRNGAVPGTVISPKDGIVSPDDAAEVKQRFAGDFGGDNMGKPIVMRGPTEVKQFSYSPEAMKLREIRNIPEERLSAALGIPAAVVGYGAGLEGVKVGRTLAEYVDLAWQNGILPRTRIIAAELTEQYLSEFEPAGTADTHDFVFDTSRVPIMADYHKLVADRHVALFTGGIESRGESRKGVGQPPGKRDDVYVMQSGNLEVPSDKTLAEAPSAPVAAAAPGAPAAPGVPAAHANGNGHTPGGAAKDTEPLEVGVAAA